MLALAYLVFCFSAFASGTSAAGGWKVVHPPSSDAAGNDTFPSIRYGHTVVMHQGSMIATHGYYYNSSSQTVNWLSDTWALDALDPSHPWERLSKHISQADAHRYYSSGRNPPAPAGRFGHVSAVIGGYLYLYGGNDGGYSRTNNDHYKPGNEFSDLWRLNLRTHHWTLQRVPGGLNPGRRHLAAAAAVHNQFILYGGTIAGQGDVWSYDPAEGAWQDLSEEVSPEERGPGRRVAATLTPWRTATTAGVVLYGGYSILPNGSHQVHDDAWFFDLDSATWRKLKPVPLSGDAAPVVPPGRLYHAAMATTLSLPSPAVAKSPKSPSPSDPSAAAGSASAAAGSASGAALVGIVAGGTLISPGIKCGLDAWAFSLDCDARSITWTRLPDLSVGLYDMSGGAVGSPASSAAAFVFGGHLCDLHRPAPLAPYSHYYVNDVFKLDLTSAGAVQKLLAAATGGGGDASTSGSVCVVPAGQDDGGEGDKRKGAEREEL